MRHTARLLILLPILLGVGCSSLSLVPTDAVTYVVVTSDTTPIPTNTFEPTPTGPPTDSPTPPEPASPTAPPTASRTLQLQTPQLTGEDVLVVQRRLIALGYIEVGTADGVFGPATVKAVQHFQVLSDLTPDGIVGPLTWERLFSDQAVSITVPPGTQQAVLEGAARLNQMALSPDGSLAVLATTSGARVFDVWAWQEIGRLSPDHWISGAAFLTSTTSNQVALALRSGTVEIWDAAGIQLAKTLTVAGDESLQATAVADCFKQSELCASEPRQGPIDATSIAASPDGRWVAVGSADTFVRVWDVQSGQVTRALAYLTGAVTSLAFSPDSQTLAGGAVSDCAANYVIAAWDVGTGQRRPAPSRVPADVYAVAYSPDGSALLSGGIDGIVYVQSLQTSDSLELSGHSGEITAIAFSPNLEMIASGSRDQTVILWDSHTGSEMFRLTGHTDEIASLAFSPQSDQLISASINGELRLWDTGTGAPLNEISLFNKLPVPTLGC